MAQNTRRGTPTQLVEDNDHEPNHAAAIEVL